MTLFADPAADAVPIHCITREAWPDMGGLAGPGLEPQPAAFARAMGFEGKPGQQALLPTPDGGLAAVLFGVEASSSRLFDPMLPGRLATLLPAGSYRYAPPLPERPDLAALSWLLSGYRFTRYKTPAAETPVLRAPAGIDAARIERIARGMTLGRDLVNTPANDMGPDALEAAALDLARRHGAAARTVRGEMLERGFPLIHAVGQAAHQAPRLVDLAWGPVDAPVVTLVGKGVTFDSGGISIKPAPGMEDMKWDMAGAAAVIGLMSALAGRKARANVVGVVGLTENMLSGAAQRPGDVVRSLSGQTIEVQNTDAEGRLVLADAIWYAQDRFSPAFTVDLATLTGAIIVSLGHEYAGMFSNDDALAAKLQAAGQASGEGVWRMPLGEAYDKLIRSDIADMKNIGGRPGGAIIGAQFIQRFVRGPWAHLDIAGMAWSSKDGPLTPKGATAYGVRLLDRLVADHLEAAAQQ